MYTGTNGVLSSQEMTSSIKRNQYSLSNNSVNEVVSNNKSFSSPYRPENSEKSPENKVSYINCVLENNPNTQTFQKFDIEASLANNEKQQFTKKSSTIQEKVQQSELVKTMNELKQEITTFKAIYEDLSSKVSSNHSMILQILPFTNPNLLLKQKQAISQNFQGNNSQAKNFMQTSQNISRMFSNNQQTANPLVATSQQWGPESLSNFFGSSSSNDFSQMLNLSNVTNKAFIDQLRANSQNKDSATKLKQECTTLPSVFNGRAQQPINGLQSNQSVAQTQAFLQALSRSNGMNSTIQAMLQRQELLRMQQQHQHSKADVLSNHENVNGANRQHESPQNVSNSPGIRKSVQILCFSITNKFIFYSSK